VYLMPSYVILSAKLLFLKLPFVIMSAELCIYSSSKVYLLVTAPLEFITLPLVPIIFIVPHNIYTGVCSVLNVYNSPLSAPIVILSLVLLPASTLVALQRAV
jgi:hypothetical protein